MKHPRTQRINRQKLYYSLYLKDQIVYEYDEDGNKIVEYIDDEGNPVYRDTGTVEDFFDTPVEFWASINSQLNELQAREWGVDQSSVYSQLKLSKLQREECPLVYGTKIWLETPIGWKDEEHKIPDESTADFTVKGILTDRLQWDFFLLQRNNNA